ncbi:unnamed protein product, partial [Musa hybrid cultivar]
SSRKQLVPAEFGVGKWQHEFPSKASLGTISSIKIRCHTN